MQSIKKQLTEYSYRSSQEVAATTIIAVLESSIIEIYRLQKELDTANQEIKKLNTPAVGVTPEVKDGE